MSRDYCRIKALGMVNALGSSAGDIAPLLFRKGASCLTSREDLVHGRSILVGAVADVEITWPATISELKSRNAQLLIRVFTQIEDEVKQARERYGASRLGVILGSSTSGISEGEHAVASFLGSGEKPSDYRYAQQEMGSVAKIVALLAESNGPSYTISTACSSSAKVFRSAKLLLSTGICDAVIVGGTDTLCGLTTNGFAALELLSQGIANPFSKNRDGINIGEGSCLMLLTREAGGVQVVAVGESSDAYHISTPDPEARGAKAAMEMALKNGSLSASDVTYINLHGTGTSHNDQTEAKAINSVFGADVYCSSTKPLVGHMLGASGATEIGFCYLALERYLASSNGSFPLAVHHYDGHYDPNISPLNICDQEEDLLSLEKVVVLSNSFGFGGSNCSVVLSANVNQRK